MIEIRHGDRGPEVVAVQCLVNRSRPANVLNVDGVFLERTRAAVIDLQRRSGINPPNGMVGYRTWQELARSPPVSVVNAVDIYDPAQGEAIPPSMRAAPGLIATGGLSKGSHMCCARLARAPGRRGRLRCSASSAMADPA